MSRALPSTKKTHSEQHKQILRQLLKEESNKSCVDCKTSKNPRWASWNLGCFLCIRCSGIHRSMGTHISKVKSVDLDAWTDEQIESMVKWGNRNCNLYWESKLPENYVPDQSKLDNFIKTKYDIKKWALSPQIPEPSTLAGAARPVTLPASVSKPASKSDDLLSSAPIASKPHKSHHHHHHHKEKKPINLLDDDDDFGAFTSSPSPTPNPVAASHTTPIASNKPQFPSNTTPGTSISPAQSSRQTPQSAQSTGGSLSGRPDLKKSILSLYSSPSSSNQFLPQKPVQQQYQPVSQYQQPSQYQQSSQYQPQQPQQTYDLNSVSSSLNGLNFSSNQTPAAKTSYNQPSYNTPSFNSNSSSSSVNVSQKPPSWNNEWADSSTGSLNKWPSTNGTHTVNGSGLDDELFKNVWN